MSEAIGQNLAIIGAGGIGSKFLQIFFQACQTNQFGQFSLQHVTVFDPKAVREANCMHQDYDRRYEIGLPKALVMVARYGVKGRVAEFDKADCGDYDAYIICADNAYIRTVIYKHCKSTGKPFLDMRCQGDLWSIYTDKCDEKGLLKRLGETPESKEGFSCMTAEDLVNETLQLGNFAVSVAGLQLLLNRHRGAAFPAKVELQAVI